MATPDEPGLTFRLTFVCCWRSSQTSCSVASATVELTAGSPEGTLTAPEATADRAHRALLSYLGNSVEVFIEEVADREITFDRPWPFVSTGSGNDTAKATMCIFRDSIQFVRLSVSSTDALSGHFALRLTHRGTTEITQRISFNASAIEFKAALESLGNIDSVYVVKVVVDPVTWSTEFHINFIDMGDVPLVSRDELPSRQSRAPVIVCLSPTVRNAHLSTNAPVLPLLDRSSRNIPTPC